MKLLIMVLCLTSTLMPNTGAPYLRLKVPGALRPHGVKGALGLFCLAGVVMLSVAWMTNCTGIKPTLLCIL